MKFGIYTLAPMNINPFINLFGALIGLYIWILIIWIVLSWLIFFKVVNQYQPFVRKLNEILFKLTNPVLQPIRRVQLRLFGSLNGIDLSPIFLFILLYFIKDLMYTYLYTY